MYKIDVSRAFRQIKIDPADIDWLGLKFDNQYFINRSMAFGSRNGSLIFQRCTDTIRQNMTQNGFPSLFNYLDDVIFSDCLQKFTRHLPFYSHYCNNLV